MFLLMTVVLVVAFGSFVSMQSYVASQNLSDMESIAQLTSDAMETRELLFSAQEGLEKEIRGYTNLLTRGHNKDELQEAFNQFNDGKYQVRTALDALHGKMASNPAFEVENIQVEEIISQWERITQTYSGYIGVNNPETMDKSKVADKSLADSDALLMGVMSDLSAKIKAHSNTHTAEVMNDIKVKFQSAKLYTIVSGSIIVLASIIIIGMLGSRIIRMVGAEPSDIQAKLKEIASGNLTVDIPVKTGDKASIAASAMLMLLNMRSIAQGLQRETKAVSEVISNVIKRGNDTRELSGVLKSMEAIHRTAMRFKIRNT